MKKNIVIILILYLFICLISGCSDKSSYTIRTKSQSNNGYKSYGEIVDDNTCNISKFNIPNEEIVINTFPIDNELIYLITMPTSEEVYNIYIYNLDTSIVVEETLIQIGKNKSVDFLCINNKLCINIWDLKIEDVIITYSEDNADSVQRDNVLLIYDSKLCELKKINLSQIGISNFFNVYAISDSLNKIVYFDISGGKRAIYIFDVKSESRSPIYTLSSEVGELSQITNIAFIDDGKTVAFTGEVANNSSQILEAFGTINIDGSNLNVYAYSDLSDEIYVSKKRALFIDKNTEIGVYSSGRIYSYNFKAEEIEIYTLVDKNESQNACLSDDGNYIITYIIGKLQNGEAIFHYRVYCCDSMEMVNEFDVTFSGETFDLSYIKNIYVFEQDNKITVRYSLNNTIKIYQYQMIR